MPLVPALPRPWVRDEAFSLEYGGPALPWGRVSSPAAVSSKGQLSQDQQGVGWLSMALEPQHAWCPYTCVYTSHRHQHGPQLQQDQGPRHGPQLWSNVTMALVAAQVTHISMTLASARPQTTTCSLVAVQTLGICTTSGGNRRHGHQPRP